MDKILALGLQYIQQIVPGLPQSSTILSRVMCRAQWNSIPNTNEQSRKSPRWVSTGVYQVTRICLSIDTSTRRASDNFPMLLFAQFRYGFCFFRVSGQSHLPSSATAGPEVRLPRIRVNNNDHLHGDSIWSKTLVSRLNKGDICPNFSWTKYTNSLGDVITASVSYKQRAIQAGPGGRAVPPSLADYAAIFADGSQVQTHPAGHQKPRGPVQRPLA